jgi:hypothetical protein
MARAGERASFPTRLVGIGKNSPLVIPAIIRREPSEIEEEQHFLSFFVLSVNPGLGRRPRLI